MVAVTTHLTALQQRLTETLTSLASRADRIARLMVLMCSSSGLDESGDGVGGFFDLLVYLGSAVVDGSDDAVL